MSKISTVYDGINSSLATLFPTKTQLFDPYDLDQNPDHILNNSYGIRVNSASGLSQTFKDFNISRDFEIVFTRSMVKTPDQRTTLNTVQKNLLEDIYTVTNDFYNVDKFGLGDSAAKVEIGGLSGIDSALGDEKRFLSISINFIIDVIEDLT